MFTMSLPSNGYTHHTIKENHKRTLEFVLKQDDPSSDEAEKWKKDNWTPTEQN
jgi:hypothetical protein